VCRTSIEQPGAIFLYVAALGGGAESTGLECTTAKIEILITGCFILCPSCTQTLGTVNAHLYLSFQHNWGRTAPGVASVALGHFCLQMPHWDINQPALNEVGKQPETFWTPLSTTSSPLPTKLMEAHGPATVPDNQSRQI
jgi:hypothetical protein